LLYKTNKYFLGKLNGTIGGKVKKNTVLYPNLQLLFPHNHFEKPARDDFDWIYITELFKTLASKLRFFFPCILFIPFPLKVKNILKWECVFS
jgi:hypothetical protein